MIVLRRHYQNSIAVGDLAFEKVPTFKYLGVDVNNNLTVIINYF